MSLKSKFKNFSSTNEEAFKREDPKIQKFSDRVNFLRSDIKSFKPIENQKSKVRFVPIPGENYFAAKISVHYGVGPEGSSVCCPVMKEQKCPLCQKYRELIQKEDEESKKKAKDFRAQERSFTWVIDRLKQEEGPQAFIISPTTVHDIRKTMEHPETGAIINIIDDLDTGYDVLFTRAKKSEKAMYITINDVARSPDPSPLGTDTQATPWLEYIEEHPLSNILTFLSYDDLEKLAFGEPEGMESTMSDEEQSKLDAHLDKVLGDAPLVAKEEPPISNTESKEQVPTPEAKPASTGMQNLRDKLAKHSKVPQV